MEGLDSVPDVKFFPVVHLLTGPPGLTRNGGIWKKIKTSMKDVNAEPRFMVQAMHFTTYNLSQTAWEDWGFDGPYTGRLEMELEKTFGNHRDVFLDSGGFQLLHSDKIDLSKWNLKVNREDILKLQLKYNPNRIASLDSPVSPNFPDDTVEKLQKISIENAIWLLEQFRDSNSVHRVYIAIHGRNPSEVADYLRELWKSMPQDLLKKENYGLALGSQVPLTGMPGLISENITVLLRWMEKKCSPNTPLHIFGVGDSVIGSTIHGKELTREISYDNSTYAQSAFRLRVYDPLISAYKKWTPQDMPNCSCWACNKLREIGNTYLHEIMTAPAYKQHQINELGINRSDILAYIALHNASWWKKRLTLVRRTIETNAFDIKTEYRKNAQSSQLDYVFPLRQFKPVSKNLLILPCTKSRPYSRSQTHTRVAKRMEKSGLKEGNDYDRITVSGLFGPVHWKDETLPSIMGYDFKLEFITTQEHVNNVRFITGSVLNVIRKKYESVVGYLWPRAYLKTFGPVIKSFEGDLVENINDIPSKF